MKVNIKVEKEVDIKVVRLSAKIRDEGTYTFLDSEGNKVLSLEESYVPSLFPGDHYGDYLDLEIDIETGQILNWKKIDQKTFQRFMNEL